MLGVVIFAFFIIFFWASFEQAGGSMSIFAKDYTSRILSGNAAFIFNIVDIIITVVPIAIITYVLFLLFKQTFKRYFISNLISIGLLLVIKNYIVDEDKIHAQIQENKKKEPKKPSKFQQKLQEVMEQQEAMKAQQKKK